MLGWRTNGAMTRGEGGSLYQGLALVWLAAFLIALAGCGPGVTDPNHPVATATAGQPTVAGHPIAPTPSVASDTSPTAGSPHAIGAVSSPSAHTPSPIQATAPPVHVTTASVHATPSLHAAASSVHSAVPLATAASAATARPSPNGSTVERYGVFELTLRYPTDALKNPWEDARVTASFTAPSGKQVTIDGFYYDTGVYKARFAPTEIGRYTYSATIQGPTPFAPLAGGFDVVASARKGFVHASSGDPKRLVFADGTLFNGLGLQDCFGPTQPDGDILTTRNFIDVGDVVDSDAYFATYARAGFNLLRWSINNCNFPIASRITTDGNTYLVNQGKLGDQLLQVATRHGFHVMLTFFMGPPYPDAATNPAEQRAIERYVDYAMARYGAYTDIWELTNETEPPSTPDSWLRFVADYVHQHDPDHRIVTNSNPRDGDWTYLDARSPHWYYNEPPVTSVTTMANMIGRFRVNGEPVIFGELGNEDCNWDPTSALRMRLRLWSAFFNGGVVIFWNSSGAKNYCKNGASNMYLGPEERGYTQVLQDVTANVAAPVTTIPLALSNQEVRGWGLSSPTLVLGYLHHFTSHTGAVATNVQVAVPFDGTATWIDPATGKVLATAPVQRGTVSLTTPPFAIDLALRISETKAS